MSAVSQVDQDQRACLRPWTHGRGGCRDRMILSAINGCDRLRRAHGGRDAAGAPDNLRRWGRDMREASMEDP